VENFRGERAYVIDGAHFGWLSTGTCVEVQESMYHRGANLRIITIKMVLEFRTKIIAQNYTTCFCGISTKNIVVSCIKRF
jgi:hypothetical protein